MALTISRAAVGLSFDSTSPLRQAFIDDEDNYYSEQKNYSAISAPQVDGNVKLKGRIRAVYFCAKLIDFIYICATC
mgnify:CR=1 FL=1